MWKLGRTEIEVSRVPLGEKCFARSEDTLIVNVQIIL